nr:glutamine synthetase family protein [uncultured Porphyromonas sp.]
MEYNLNPIARALGKQPAEFTKADLIHYIVSNDIHALNFRYTAADGRLKELNFVLQDVDYLDEVLSSGERVDGSSLFPGFMEAGSSDLYVVPIFSSAFLDPFADEPTISFFCAYMDKDGQPLSIAPDQILRRAAQAFREVTGGLEFHAMGELEYYVISPKEDGYEAVDQRGYHEMAPFSKQIAFRTEAMRLIAQCGGQIKYGHGEVGNFSTEEYNYEQNEIEFLPVPVEEAARHLQLGKWILFELGWRMGLKVTFAPKIIVGKAGSGMHIHTKIVDKQGVNQYVDAEGQLTDTARKAVAGMMSLAPSLTAFGNMNPTSYLRLVPHQEAPTTVCWGDRNRSALVRVPLGWSAKVDMSSLVNPLEQPQTKRYTNKQTIEFRASDGSANAYLLLAGITTAVRRGFELPNALELAKQTYVSVNIHKDEFASSVEHLDSLPASCVASAERLRQDRAAYEAMGVFSPAAIDGVIRQLEAFDDADLRAKAQADPQFLMELVERHLYC